MKMNGQSGWGLTEEDLDQGKPIQKSQLNDSITSYCVSYIGVLL
jgi:hypothetical protein